MFVIVAEPIGSFQYQHWIYLKHNELYFYHLLVMKRLEDVACLLWRITWYFSRSWGHHAGNIPTDKWFLWLFVCHCVTVLLRKYNTWNNGRIMLNRTSVHIMTTMRASTDYCWQVRPELVCNFRSKWNLFVLAVIHLGIRMNWLSIKTKCTQT
jgi:hypothetical protein